MNGIFPLRGTVKHFEWGGDSYIPHLCGMDNSEKKPFAEYWMGIHPSGISEILINGQWKPLSETASFSFLLKVLDVKKMLSIQVHPDIQGAIAGYEKENALGIPLDAPNRNYRDRNHKPEMMVALSDFWLLHGFKPQEEIVDVLTNVTALNSFLPVFAAKSYEGLYHHIMRLHPEEVEKLLLPLKRSLIQDPPVNKNEEDFWAARAFKMNEKSAKPDAGIFSIYLFNLVHLKKGEGIFQGAGLPHAYLEGQNVELMANSDNVLRGGLTSKNIDVSELLRHVKCEATYPHILPYEPGTTNQGYESSLPDFSLRSFHLPKHSTMNWIAEKDEIILITEGEIRTEGLLLKTGSPAAFISKGEVVNIEIVENAVIYIAS